MRDCENCIHYVLQETKSGEDPLKIYACESWNCEFEPKERGAEK